MAWRDIKGWPVTRPCLLRGVACPLQAGAWEPAPDPGLCQAGRPEPPLEQRVVHAGLPPAAVQGSPPPAPGSPLRPLPPGTRALTPPHGSAHRGPCVPLAGPGSQAAAGRAAAQSSPRAPAARGCCWAAGLGTSAGSFSGGGGRLSCWQHPERCPQVPGVAEGALCSGLGAGKS